MRTEEPRAIHLADYKEPDFRIETVKLDFALDPEATRVTATTVIVRKTAKKMSPAALDSLGMAHHRPYSRA